MPPVPTPPPPLTPDDTGNVGIDPNAPIASDEQRKQQTRDQAAKRRQEYRLEQEKAITQASQEARADTIRRQAEGQVKPPEEKFCTICGMGSHRLDWQDNDNPTCDDHPDTKELTDAEKDQAGLNPTPSAGETSAVTRGAGVTPQTQAPSAIKREGPARETPRESAVRMANQGVGGAPARPLSTAPTSPAASVVPPAPTPSGTLQTSQSRDSSTTPTSTVPNQEPPTATAKTAEDVEKPS